MTMAKQTDILHSARQRVWADWPEIVGALTEQAKQGSCTHAKFLYEFAFTTDAKCASEEEELPGPSLAEILIEKLNEVLQEPEPADEALEPDA
jgi:hypothetical protein